MCSVQLVVSNSPGTISVLQCVESEVKNLVSWKAHDFEPWVAAWDRWNQSMVFTGKYSTARLAWLGKRMMCEGLDRWMDVLSLICCDVFIIL